MPKNHGQRKGATGKYKGRKYKSAGTSYGAKSNAWERQNRRERTMGIDPNDAAGKWLKENDN